MLESQIKCRELRKTRGPQVIIQVIEIRFSQRTKGEKALQHLHSQGHMTTSGTWRWIDLLRRMDGPWMGHGYCLARLRLVGCFPTWSFRWIWNIGEVIGDGLMIRRAYNVFCLYVQKNIQEHDGDMFHRLFFAWGRTWQIYIIIYYIVTCE
jgi:hypothetical protein